MDLVKQKVQAFSIHLSASALVIGLLVVHVVFIAYTPSIFDIEGGYGIAGILFAVDLVLGPVLTAILYKKGKKGLRGDLILVVLLQLSAFFYGSYTLYSQRPLYLVYLDGDFWIASAAATDVSSLNQTHLAPSLVGGPKLVFVEYPEGKGAMELAVKMMQEGKGLYKYPEYYQSLKDNREKVLAGIGELDKLFESESEWSDLLNAKLVEEDLLQEDVLVARVMGFKGFVMIILDRKNLELIGIIGPTQNSVVR